MKNRKIMNVICSLLLLFSFGFMSIASSSSKSDSPIPDNNNNETAATQANTNSYSDTEVTTQPDETTQPEVTEGASTLPFSYTTETEGLSVGTIAKDDDFYIGLACVRSAKKVYTTVSGYTKKVSKKQEVIYPIVQVYNGTNDLKTFHDDTLEVYADSVRATDPDTGYLNSIDKIEELSSYPVDGHRSAIVVDAFVVDKGWKELTVYCGNVSWTLSKKDIKSSTYKPKSMFDPKHEYEYTKKGTTVYSGDYELTYDGFKLYKYKSFLTKKNFAVFEFTIKNTSDTDLDYDLVGFNMRGYWNSMLMEDADFIYMDKKVDKHANVFEVKTIRAGKTAKVYVAFETSQTKGTFEICYDTGYITHNGIAYACAKK